MDPDNVLAYLDGQIGPNPANILAKLLERRISVAIEEAGIINEDNVIADRVI